MIPKNWKGNVVSVAQVAGGEEGGRILTTACPVSANGCIKPQSGSGAAGVALSRPTTDPYQIVRTGGFEKEI